MNKCAIVNFKYANGVWWKESNTDLILFWKKREIIFSDDTKVMVIENKIKG